MLLCILLPITFGILFFVLVFFGKNSKNRFEKPENVTDTFEFAGSFIHLIRLRRILKHRSELQLIDKSFHFSNPAERSPKYWDVLAMFLSAKRIPNEFQDKEEF